MSVWDWDPEERLRVQFTKALLKGAVTNAHLYPDITDLGGALATETCVVRVDAANGTTCVFTPSRLLVHDSTGTRTIPYDSVVKCNWITRDELSRDSDETVELKRQYFDRLYLVLDDGDAVELATLGQAYYPVLKFYGWLLEKREKSKATSKR